MARKLKPQRVHTEEIEPEEWVPIRYARDYFISNWGRVYSYRSDKYLKPRPSPWGYAQVCLSMNGERVWAYVHRLVAEHFIPGEDEGLEVNHIDGDKLYNNEINLEWVTKGMNNKHAFDTGLRKGRGINVRINETDVVTASIQEAADLVGMTLQGVRYALKNGTKTRDGWSFSYVD